MALAVMAKIILTQRMIDGKTVPRARSTDWCRLAAV